MDKSPISLNLSFLIITLVSLLLSVFFIFQNWRLNQKLEALIKTQPTPVLGSDLQRRTAINAEIKPGLELYKFDHKRYPDSLKLLIPTYLVTLPVDPITKEPYLYKVSPDKFSYVITVKMDDGTILIAEPPK